MADLKRTLFRRIKEAHDQLATTLAMGKEPRPEAVHAIISLALRSSTEIVYLEDREELRSILRTWGSYLSLKGEEFPNIDIDQPDVVPKISVFGRP
jgi:hypothetical protein